MRLKSNSTKIKFLGFLAMFAFFVILGLMTFSLFPKGITREVDVDDREVLDNIFAGKIDSVLFAENKPKTPFEGGSFDAFLLVCNDSFEDELRREWKEKSRFDQHKGSKPSWFTTAMMYQDTRWEKEMIINGREVIVSCFFNKNKSALNRNHFLFTYVCINPAIF